MQPTAAKAVHGWLQTADGKGTSTPDTKNQRLGMSLQATLTPLTIFPPSMYRT